MVKCSTLKGNKKVKSFSKEKNNLPTKEQELDVY